MTTRRPQRNASVDLRSIALEAVQTLSATRRKTEGLLGVLNRINCPACIASIGGKTFIPNTAFAELFATGEWDGRERHSFIGEDRDVFFRRCERLMLCDCKELAVNHTIQMGRGNIAEVKSLLSTFSGNYSGLILILSSITRIVGKRGKPASSSLVESVESIDAMSERDRKCLILLAKCVSTRDVAKELGVCQKTVENRRRSLLSSLQCNNLVELGQLLCRLQDRGFGDFGAKNLQ